MSDLMQCLKFEQIFVYSEPIDFRKQLNGLIEVVLSELEKEPNDGSLYIFRNRQRNRLKLLLWNHNGYFMGFKRLEKGKFDFPEEPDEAIQVTEDELYGLIMGMPMIQYSSTKKPIYHH